MRLLLLLAVLVIDTLAFSSIAHRDVLDVARDAQLNTFVQAVNAAGLEEALAKGPLTIFAPTDEAFANLPSGQLDSLLNDKEELSNVLLFHVIGDAALGSSALPTAWYHTLAGFSLRVRVVEHGDHGHTFVGDGEVEVADLVAGKSVIHIVDEVLLPPSLADAVRLDGSLRTLGSLVEQTGVGAVLSGTGPHFTLFAPDDAAFEAMSPTDAERLLNATTGHLVETLYYHLLRYESASDCLPAGSLTTFIGLNIVVEKEPEPHVNGAHLTSPDIKATNGVMHVIDAVLQPPSIMDMLTRIGNESFYQMYGSFSFSRFTRYIAQAGLTEELSTKPFTVFAPSDAAFEQLESLPGGDQLRDVLLYHLLPNQIISSVAFGHGWVTMANGERAHIDTSSEHYWAHHIPFPHVHGAYINNVSLYWTDIAALNGVIHSITEVLMPN